MRTGWPSAEKTSARGCESEAGSLPGTARTPSMTSPATQPACSTPFTSSSSLATLSMRCVAASSKTPWVTAGTRVIPSTKSGFSCAPRATDSPRANKNASAQPSRQMRHNQCRSRLPLRPASPRRLPSRHTRPRPTPGRTPHPAPTNLPHPRNRPTRPDPTQMEGRLLGLLRYSRSQQRTPPKPSTQIIELGRRTARGYRNPTNYQLRMLLIAGGLDASTHTQL